MPARYSRLGLVLLDLIVGHLGEQRQGLVELVLGEEAFGRQEPGRPGEAAAGIFAELGLKDGRGLLELLLAEPHVGQFVIELLAEFGVLGLGQARCIGSGRRRDFGRFLGGIRGPVGLLFMRPPHVEAGLRRQRAGGEFLGQRAKGRRCAVHPLLLERGVAQLIVGPVGVGIVRLLLQPASPASPRPGRTASAAMRQSANA